MLTLTNIFPLSKIYGLRVGKTLFSTIPLILAACAQAPKETNSFENIRISAMEAAQGDRTSKLLLAAFPVVEDAELRKRIDDILLALASTSKIPKDKLNVFVLKTDMVQAYALPNGHLFVTTGLLKLLDHDAELAAILSHEVAHVAMHDAKEGQAFAENALKTLANFNVQHVKGASIANDLTTTAYYGVRREQELRADHLGFFLLRQAGFDCSAFPRVLQKLIQAETTYGHDVEVTHIDDDHPATRDRLRESVALTIEHKGSCDQNTSRTANASPSIKELAKRLDP